MFLEQLRHWSNWGFIYWNAACYRAAMRLLRGPNEREEMLGNVAQEIDGASVLELCCGAGDLRGVLEGDGYQGIDQNPVFVAPLRQQGVSVQLGDILKVKWPAADCLVIIDSLYHFTNRMDSLFSRIQAFECKRVIISEPVDNLMSNLPAALKPLGSWATRVNAVSFPERYTPTGLRDLFESAGFQSVSRVGHNMIGVWNKQG